MKPFVTGVIVAVVALFTIALLGAVVFVKSTGLSARATALPGEEAVARRLRALAVPSDYAQLSNPVLMNADSIRNGMAHFADHCALCHGNDGRGSETGKSMFPPAPDMTASATQSLDDGALFYVVEHGIRFTGMPAFGTETMEGEEASWHLVSFIRHLPDLSEDEIAEMEEMNPRPPAEVRQEIEEQRFLEGQ